MWALLSPNTVQRHASDYALNVIFNFIYVYHTKFVFFLVFVGRVHYNLLRLLTTTNAAKDRITYPCSLCTYVRAYVYHKVHITSWLELTSACCAHVKHYLMDAFQVSANKRATNGSSISSGVRSVSTCCLSMRARAFTLQVCDCRHNYLSFQLNSKCMKRMPTNAFWAFYT